MTHILEKCPICQRMIHPNDMTIHHYIPKSEGGSVETTMRICKTCHRTLHFCIPIENISFYDTVEKLESHCKFNKFIEWIRTKGHSSHYSPKKCMKYWVEAS